MTKIFTPSINILRDAQRDWDYLVTPNAKRVFQILSNNFLAGNRAFSIIGTYGTGKSAFLLALEQHLKGEKKVFDTVGLKVSNAPIFSKVVGSYLSLAEAIAQELEIDISNSKDMGTATIAGINALPKDQTRVFVIDEFGKFLEYAAQHQPEKELYFIQQLAEYVAEPANNALLLFTLHQSFDAYALELTLRQRNEWEKVKGRLTEVAFNEPVEQLLHIAAARMPKEGQDQESAISASSALLSLVESNSLLNFNFQDKESLAHQLYPIDILSGAVLALSLQKYGQNERSLFSFLESEAHLGLRHFLAQQSAFAHLNYKEFYGLPQVYDYLSFNFYSILSSHHNPDYFKWNIIKDSLDRVDSVLEEELIPAARKLVKAIGLLSIFASKGAKINHELLESYGNIALGLQEVNPTMAALESHKIIRYQRFRDSYILFEGTDFAIEEALREARKQIDPVEDVVPRLLQYFNLPPIAAKSYFYRKGTPRYFKFVFSNAPVLEIKTEDKQIDGYINLLFEETLPEKEIAANCPQIIWGIYPQVDELRTLIREIDVSSHVRKQIIDDPIAKKEVDRIKHDLVDKLNNAVWELVYKRPGEIKWFYQGESVENISNTTRLNQFLSTICEHAYPSTPTFRNELVNRSNLSSAISTARKKLIKAMVEYEQDLHLGFPENKFPAEKTIFLSLLANKLHGQKEDGSIGFFDKPTDETFIPLWNAGESFFESARDNRRKLSELVDIWLAPPFRLKKGFLDFWLPIYLYIKRSDFTLFDENYRLIPYVTTETLELVFRAPHKYYIKSFELAGKRLNIFNKYRELTSQTAQERITQEGFLDTVKPFLVFYASLPEYAKQTQSISKDANAFRTAVAKSKDPEKAFFEDFPAALGFSLNDLEADDEKLGFYAMRIRECIRELKEAFPNLIKKIEAEILAKRSLEADLAFEEYKPLLEAQFQDVKVHLIRREQKAFYMRLTAPMDDATSWISSICQAVYNGSLERIKDMEVPYLLEKLGDAFRELDNLREFANFESIGQDEEIIKFEMTSLKKGLAHKTFSNSTKVNSDSLKDVKMDLKKKLSANKDLNIAAVAELLKELLQSDHE